MTRAGRLGAIAFGAPLAPGQTRITAVTTPEEYAKHAAAEQARVDAAMLEHEKKHGRLLLPTVIDNAIVRTALVGLGVRYATKKTAYGIAAAALYFLGGFAVMGITQPTNSPLKFLYEPIRVRVR